MSIVKNTLATIIAISMVSAIGGLVFNTMPLLLNTVSQTLNFTPEQLGALSLTAGIGYLVGTLTGPLWVDRVNWRVASLVIITCAAGSFLLASKLSGIGLFVGFAAFGFFCSLAAALGIRVLGDMPDPERAYGTRLSVELVSIAFFLILLPIFFIAKGGFSGAMIGLALMTVFLGLGTLFMPARSVLPSTLKVKGFPSWGSASRSWIMLFVFTIYLLANVGLFFFLAVIAQNFNPSAEQFGVMFGVLKWLGGAAGAVGAIIGARAGIKRPHFVASALVLIGVLGLFLAHDIATFMIASWVWEFGFTLGCLYLTTAIVRFDPANKLVVLVPMAFGIAMIFGGKIAGQLLANGGANDSANNGAAALYIFVVLCSVLPPVFILFTAQGRKPAQDMTA